MLSADRKPLKGGRITFSETSATTAMVDADKGAAEANAHRADMGQSVGDPESPGASSFAC